ncbi:Quinol monooxygenase YgiN [Cohaesibacter gelatinilyticus]|uniref:Quinol monooxygenase YgiN n=2 Tax=Cohaesibacter gelatinilyticus TaxID=372072 RepID=A0A285PCN8_9HYPH|nr:Quinol monooxygenase YgiN [Cohaesibacter gelatinilyticus]
MVHLIATLKIKPGSIEALLSAAAPCIEATRKEQGCISYDLYRSTTDPNTLVFVEVWKSREALTLHFATEHLLKWKEQSVPHIVKRSAKIINSGEIEEI